MRELSLFTGAGGGLLGSMLLGWRTVAAVEWDAYCQRVLCARGGYMADDSCGQSRESEAGNGREGARGGGQEGFPVYSDIRDFHPVPGSCDIVTGGFPCQPFSQAGKRLGEDDPRNMWPSALRILVESGAPLALWENVPGLLSAKREMCAYHWHPVQWFDGRWYCAKCRGRVADAAVLADYYFGKILADLAREGFDAEWCVLGADDVGAPHRRKRLWILAYRDGASAGVRPGAVGEEARTAGRDTAFDVPSGRGEVSGGGSDVSDTESQRRQWSRRTRDGGTGPENGHSPWHIDPADVGHADAAGPQGHGRPVERAGECAAAETGTEQGRGVCAGIAQSRLGFLAHGLASGLGGRVPRVAVGVPERVNRLRALGNGQVPQCMAAAFTYLAGQAGLLT